MNRPLTRIDTGGEDVNGRILKNVVVSFRSLSPRAFIFIRFIMVHLLNAHLCHRIVQLHLTGRIENSLSYKRLKQSLNSHSTFMRFLSTIARDWEWDHGSSSESTPVSTPATTPRQRRSDESLPTVPGKRRLAFFNTPVGKSLRLSKDLGHELLSGCRPPKRCYICGMITTSKCSVCTVHLCRNPFGANRRSCWTQHHENARV